MTQRFLLKHQWLSITLCSSALIFAVVTSSSADLLLIDNMNYGTSNDGDGVGDWIDASNRLSYVASPNLTFTGDTDYVNDTNNLATNGSLQRDNNIDSRFFRRDISDAGLTGEFWFSGLVQINDSGAGTGDIVGVSFNESASSYPLAGDALGIGVSSTGTGPEFEPVFRDFSASSNSFDSGNSLTTGETFLLLANLNIDSDDDSFDMWVFDSTDDFGLTETSLGTPHLSSTTADFGDTLDWLQVGGINGFLSRFDQFRLSNLSGDAGLTEVLTLEAPVPSVPEPGNIAIWSLIGLGLAFRYRRRNR